MRTPLVPPSTVPDLPLRSDQIRSDYAEDSRMARTELEHPRRSPPRIGHAKPDCSREPRLLSTAPMPGVPVTALTYAEAQERARLIDVSGYHVDLDLTGGEEMFGSVTVVRFGCRAPGASTFAEIRPARLRRVVLNGRDLDPRALDGNRLPLPGLQAANELRVEADMPYSRTGAGLHRFTDDADGETTSPCTADWTTHSGYSRPSISRI